MKNRTDCFLTLQQIGIDKNKDLLTEDESELLIRIIRYINSLLPQITDDEIRNIVNWLNSANYNVIEGYDSLLISPMIDQVFSYREDLTKEVFLMETDNYGLDSLKIDLTILGLLEDIKFNYIPVLKRENLSNIDEIKSFISSVDWINIESPESEVLSYMIQYIEEFSYPNIIIDEDLILTKYQKDRLKNS